MTGDQARVAFESTLADGPEPTWRQRLCELLGRVRDAGWTTDDVVLVAGELVANAIEHGGGVRRLRVTAGADGVVVEVEDATPTVPDRLPVLAEEPPERGRGLAIVAALADAWGWHATATGKAVWARWGDAAQVRSRGSAA